ncbi:flagellar basal body-associated FliL family protein [Halopseudomonas pelagia]|uniref:flagellar basal body-associated FliL family protein n=1 Tax=Halopseudomonas pelagia TaxID=553151 RepID=UPI0003AA7FAC|nr:flagellar basal body-associated FliL family protein [Halopseudomonas pelagia]|tara:strand:- start:373 stop:888 length:516 start_codon:yes stop_codon:yes gene_type:complete
MAKQAREEQPATDAAETPVKSKKKLLILVGVGLLAVLLSAGGVSYMLMGGDDEVADSAEAAQPLRATALYQPLDPAFVVNYTHEGRKRYMQVNVVLMGRDAEGMAGVASHMPLLRNELVLLFSSEEFQTLFSPEGKEALRERATLAVKALLERELGNPVIESVLFTNIVLQ